MSTRDEKTKAEELENLEAFEPKWDRECEVCGQSPVVAATGLCGPCTWGEADTAAGLWWGDDDEKRLADLRASVLKERQ